MGDHRASVKIEMEFHGVKDKYDGWINWFPGECDGIDDRVIEFMRSVYERGMEVWREDQAEYFATERARATEERERAELARLQAKYGR